VSYIVVKASFPFFMHFTQNSNLHSEMRHNQAQQAQLSACAGTMTRFASCSTKPTFPSNICSAFTAR
jgi:hypothetical protein